MFRLIGPLRACVLAASLMALGPTAAADTPPAVPDKDVRVERSGSTFSVDVVMHAPVPLARAWEVLVDFDHMADFVPNLKASQIVERSDSLLKVSQKGVARYGIFSASFESVREIRLVPQREIRARNVSGNLKHMESVMQLVAEEGGTRLHYHAEVQPDFWFPPLVGPSLVQHETAEQFSAMIQEMVRRK